MLNVNSQSSGINARFVFSETFMHQLFSFQFSEFKYSISALRLCLLRVMLSSAAGNPRLTREALTMASVTMVYLSRHPQGAWTSHLLCGCIAPSSPVSP